MNLNGHLSQHTEQRTTLLPQVLQSIEILQLSSLGLVEFIERELAQNETLERVEDAAGDVTPQSASSDETFDPDRFVARDATPERDSKLDWLSAIQGPAMSLRDDLRSQLAWRDIDADLRRRVETAIEALDERGLLEMPDDELAELLGGREQVQPVLEVLQSLEPRGVGARSPIDAMLAQVSTDDPDFPLLRALLLEHLDALSRNRIPDVARAIGVEIDELHDLLERIRRLDPRPGESVAVSTLAGIRPELVVVREGADDDESATYRVIVDDVDLPVLRVRDEYVELASADDTDRSVRRYLREKIRAARELMTAVELRKDTLVRVGAAVMARQREFLRNGRSAFRPLKMSVIADELDMHNSTVSRAIAGKYVQTDHGVFALRDFFDGDRGSSRGGPPTGRMALMHAIEQLIAAEDKRNPLSDEQIVTALAGRGIELARRTVAKYRKQLGLRSSWQRRRHGNR